MTAARADGTAVAPARQRRAPRRAWAAPAAAAVWSLVYLGLGTAWLLGAGGNPADPGVDGAPGGVAVLTTWGPRTGAALITGLGALGVLLSALLAVIRPVQGRLGWLRRAPVVLAAVLGLVLSVGIPDFRLLAMTAHSAIALVLTSVGAGPEGGLGWPWPVVNLGLLTLGGLAWLATSALHHRRISGVCGDCGRGTSAARWRTPTAAARWGRWATAVAMVVPLGYAATRFAWAFGVPLGVDQAFLDELGGAAWVGAALGALAVGGAVLTLGLVQRWGEVFPRWMLGLRGRPVPVGLAVMPASIVALVVGSAGVMFVRFVLTGTFGRYFPGGDDDVAAWLPEMFWPLWSLALAAATYAYWLRRRAPCASCCTAG